MSERDMRKRWNAIASEEDNNYSGPRAWPSPSTPSSSPVEDDDWDDGTPSASPSEGTPSSSVSGTWSESPSSSVSVSRSSEEYEGLWKAANDFNDKVRRGEKLPKKVVIPEIPIQDIKPSRKMDFSDLREEKDE